MYTTQKKPFILVVDRKSLADATVGSLSVRVRLEPLFYLQENNVISLLQKNEHDITQDDITACDVMVLGRSYSEQAIHLMQTAKALGKKIIYDVDDDFTVSPKRIMLDSSLLSKENHQQHLQLANVITVPHAELAQRFHSINIHKQIIPTAIDLRRFLPGSMAKRSAFVFANRRDLRLDKGRAGFLQALKVFMSQNSEFTLDIFSDFRSEMAELPNTNHRNFLDYDVFLRELTLGNYMFAIAPLGGYEDEEEISHYKCKSAIKYLYFAAAKIPCIFSDTPVYQNVIVHGQNGLLAQNTYEGWLECLTLLKDPTLREQITNNAYQDVNKSFNINKISEEWLETISRLLAA